MGDYWLDHKRLMTRILDCIEEAGEADFGCVINTVKREDGNFATEDGLREFLAALHHLHSTGYVRFREHRYTRGGRYMGMDFVDPPISAEVFTFCVEDGYWRVQWENALFVENTKDYSDWDSPS